MLNFGASKPRVKGGQTPSFRLKRFCSIPGLQEDESTMRTMPVRCNFNLRAMDTHILSKPVDS